MSENEGEHLPWDVHGQQVMSSRSHATISISSKYDRENQTLTS